MNTPAGLPDAIGRNLVTDDKYEALIEARRLINEMVRQFELSAARAILELTDTVLKDEDLGELPPGYEWKVEYEVRETVEDSQFGPQPTIGIITRREQTPID